MSAELHEASLAGERARMEALLGARVPDDWPEERHARLFLTKLREQPSWAPWIARALVLRSEGRMIGHAGFHSGPAPAYLAEYLPGGIELGYTVFARDRRRGYAREAVVALMAFARREHPALTGFVASLSPTNAASLALVKGLGFSKIGDYDDPEDGLEHVHGLRLPPAAGWPTPFYAALLAPTRGELMSADWNDIAKTFDERVRRIVWCTVTTVDTKGRPFSRVLHPVWEGATGWIATGRQTLKTQHLAGNANVALSYWDPKHDTVIIQARAEWCDDAATKQRIWNLLKTTPEPVGYDPQLFWRAGVGDPSYGVLKLTPFRVDLLAAQEMMAGKGSTVWQA